MAFSVGLYCPDVVRAIPERDEWRELKYESPPPLVERAWPPESAILAEVDSASEAQCCGEAFSDDPTLMASRDTVFIPVSILSTKDQSSSLQT